MKKYVLMLVFVVSQVWVSSHAQMVTVTGYGPTKQAAINEAMRQAIESVTGVDISSNSKVENLELAYDAIKTSSAGLVEGYKEVSGRKTGDGSWEVRLEVTVASGLTSAANAEDEIAKKVRHWRMIREGVFRDRSVMVLYTTRNMADALDEGSPAVQALLDNIQGQLANLQFDVKLADDVAGSGSNLITSATLDEESAFRFAQMARADSIVLATLRAGQQSQGSGAVYVQVTASLKAYDPTTKRLFANVTEREKGVGGRGDAYLLEDAIAKAAEKAGSVAVPRLVDSIVQNQLPSQKPVIVQIADIDEDGSDILLEGLDEADIDYKVERLVGTMMQLKVNTTMDTTAVGRQLRKIARNNGFKLQTVLQEGDAIQMKASR